MYIYNNCLEKTLILFKAYLKDLTDATKLHYFTNDIFCLYPVPSTPTNFQIIDASLTEVVLSWKEPLQRNGIITNYHLSYGSIKTGEVIHKELASDSRTAKVQHLSPSDAYIFKLKAHTSAGGSEESRISFDLSKGEHLYHYVCLHTVSQRRTCKTLRLNIYTQFGHFYAIEI